jgi:retron-type reverse transcriptase
MKQYDNFYSDVISLPNLYQAYEKAKKGKTKKKEFLEFSKELHNNLYEIHLELLNKSYEVGGYKTFFADDYKKRKILAPKFRDVVVQYALFNFLEQIYERCFIYDSYSCRKEKGTHKGMRRLKSFVNKSSESDYFVKCDVTKYFYSIDHYVLKEIIRRKIKDENVLWLIGKFIDSHKEEIQEYHVLNSDLDVQKKGIPIGNLLSQLFSNIYLNELDYFVKNKLNLKFYVRYVDDFIFIVKDRERIKEFVRRITVFLKEKLLLRL